MYFRSAQLALALCLVTVPVHADTFHWEFSAFCGLCGPFVNQQGMPVNTGGSPADLIDQADGTLTTTNKPVNGALTITGITGTRTTNWFMFSYLYPSETDTITGLIPPDPTNPYSLEIPTNNLLYPEADPVIDQHGFAYTLNCADCGDYGDFGIVQISGQFPGNYTELGPSGIPVRSSFVLTPAAPTPEPSPMLLFAIAGLAFALYRCCRSDQGENLRNG